MMGDLNELVDACVAAATAAEGGDLVLLAQLHSDLEVVQSLAADRPEAVAVAQQAAELAEKLVLGQAPDPAQTFRQIVALVHQLQSIVRGNAGVDPP